MRLVLKIAAYTSLALAVPAANAHDRDTGKFGPADVVAEMARQYDELAELAGDDAAKGIFSSSFQWPASYKALRVCFFGGDEAHRKAIADAAESWLGPDNSVKFNWGKSGFRDCKPKGNFVYHIRIGFDETGSYSCWERQASTSANSRRNP